MEESFVFLTWSLGRDLSHFGNASDLDSVVSIAVQRVVVGATS